MASAHSNIHSEPAKMEQIITEFFTKSLHIILESRSPFASSRNYSGEQTISSPSSSTSSSSSVRRDRWFNLALRDCPTALENLDLWRQSNLEPMVVDIILVQRPSNWDPLASPHRRDLRNLSLKERGPRSWGSENDDFVGDAKSEKIIERWVLQYESRKSRDSINTNSGSKRSSNTSTHIVYKKSIVLLRSLYVTVRLLPAYKIFRELNSSGQIRNFTLAHRVSSFVEPFTRKEEAEMQCFGFTSVDTSCGRLCLSVMYRSNLSEVSSEPSTPMSPRFITDYVRSPLADPLKRFPSIPLTGVPSSSSPFERRHSWSFDISRASPPSPTSFDSRGPHFPPMSLPHHPPETSLVHDNWAYPGAFSPSSSSSPPIYIPERPLQTALLRSESAPVNIPVVHPPSLPLKGSRLSSSKTEKSSSLVQPSAKIEKLYSLGKEESGKFSGVKISCNSSPRVSFSRSSSRLSFQDDFDDSEYGCHFVVDDDDDMIGPHSRPESYDPKSHQLMAPIEPGLAFPIRRSESAGLGTLVHVLKPAPLRRDLTNSTTVPSQPTKPESRNSRHPNQNAASGSTTVSASGIALSRTITDAFEELKGYREMKELLLRQSGDRGMT